MIRVVVRAWEDGDIQPFEAFMFCVLSGCLLITSISTIAGDYLGGIPLTKLIFP